MLVDQFLIFQMFKTIFFKAFNFYLKNQFKFLKNPITRQAAKKFREYAIKQYGPQIEKLEILAKQVHF